MRHAPPAVEFPIPGTALQRLAAAVVPGAAAAAIAAWLWSWSVREPVSLIDAPKAPWALLVLAAVLGGAIAHVLWRPARGGLRWDGGGWYWLPGRDGSSDTSAGSDPGIEPDPVALATVRVQWDLGAWLLVKATPDGGGRPLQITAARQAEPTRWHALRVALYHRCGPAPSDAQRRP
ncbi:MAG: hypothetical protein HUU30_08110 [Burkholderiaceae bacterium]|jgi:hypothetical protein|nr:hypothetical protein [Aquabacterium sp.]NUP85703.1 hypothetical protein [Burkholderiaceae bacterium]